VRRLNLFSSKIKSISEKLNSITGYVIRGLLVLYLTAEMESIHGHNLTANLIDAAQKPQGVCW